MQHPTQCLPHCTIGTSNPTHIPNWAFPLLPLSFYSLLFHMLVNYTSIHKISKTQTSVILDASSLIFNPNQFSTLKFSLPFIFVFIALAQAFTASWVWSSDWALHFPAPALLPFAPFPALQSRRLTGSSFVMGSKPGNTVPKVP